MAFDQPYDLVKLIGDQDTNIARQTARVASRAV